MEIDSNCVRSRYIIGQELQQICLKKGIKQEYLAEKLNMSPKNVHRMFYGEVPITKHAYKLSQITGKPPIWFFEDITYAECEHECVHSQHFEINNISKDKKESAQRLLVLMSEILNIEDPDEFNYMVEGLEGDVKSKMNFLGKVNNRNRK